MVHKSETANMKEVENPLARANLNTQSSNL